MDVVEVRRWKRLYDRLPRLLADAEENLREWTARQLAWESGDSSEPTPAGWSDRAYRSRLRNRVAYWNRRVAHLSELRDRKPEWISNSWAA